MEKERLYYIDWLRILVVLSLVPYHSALTYTGLGDIYIRTPLHNISVLPFLIISVPLRSFFMTLLFFTSGIAAYYSIKYRGRYRFINERVRKILLPFTLGTMVLCPIQAYSKALYNGFTGNILNFVSEFFSYKIIEYLGYAHFWFLLYLFLFSLLCLPLFAKWSANETELKKITQYFSRGNNIYIPILFIVITEMLLRPFYHGPQTLIGDWANDVIYLSVFVFGFVFASDTHIQDRISRLTDISKIVLCVLIPVYILIEYLITTDGASFSYLNIILDLSKGLYECAAIIFLLSIGKRYLNRKKPVLSYLNKTSFTFYMIHFVPVSMFTYFVIGKEINVYLKYLFVVLMSYLSIFIVYEIFSKLTIHLRGAEK
jgi:Acyltransferase family.